VNRKMVARCGAALSLFAGAGILFSGRAGNLAAAQDSQKAAEPAITWKAPDPSTIPEGPMGDSIRLGSQIFNNTPKYAAKYVGNKMSCNNCHVNGGTVAWGIPLVGVPGLFPLYRDREKAVVTYQERIQQCFQRSEFGHRLPNDSPEMTALVAYSQWLSKGQVTGSPFPGRGLVKLPALTGNIKRGGQIYEQKCSLCHGPQGAGTTPVFPALWGPDAFSDGAGMNGIQKMAAFVQHNMPQTDPGSLTPQEAYDVASYVHSQPHLHFEMKDHQ
jgi:thiosulfate dehydrogenase